MKKKVLIVDDNRMNIRIISDILTQERYEVHSLLDATNIMETILQIQPDAILLDIVMPKIDGIEVCSLLQNIEELKSIPIIMLTSISDSNILRKSFDCGAFDYIKKPFDPIEVIARLKSAIRYHDQQKRLKMLALKDGLTNLYNHRSIMELTEKEFEKSIQRKSSIAFIMFDIDYFKKVNDIYGHVAGDFVLREIGEILNASSDLSNLLGRYGGEEFCITMTDQPLTSVLAFSEKLRYTIDTHDFVVEDNIHIHITISIGIAYKEPASLSSITDIIVAADKRLYACKANGRNRVEYITI